MPRRRRFSDDPFGETLERLMNENGVTYRGLAAKTKLSAGYLNHLVHGNRPVPSRGHGTIPVHQVVQVAGRELRLRREPAVRDAVLVHQPLQRLAEGVVAEAAAPGHQR